MAFIIGSLWDQERLTMVRQSGGHLDSDLPTTDLEENARRGSKQISGRDFERFKCTFMVECVRKFCQGG